MARKLKTKSFMPVTHRPSDGGRLLTDMTGETPSLMNYSVKKNFRRITEDQEAVREGDALFQPNQLLDVGSQPFPPVAPNEPITLVHDAIFPNGQIVTILASPSRIFAFDSQSSFGVYFFGPDIVTSDATLETFKILGNWTGEFITGHTFRVIESLYNDGKYTVAAGGSSFDGTHTTILVDENITATVPYGLIVAPVYGNEIIGIDQILKKFTIAGDHTGAFLDNNTFQLIGSPSNDGKYTVNGNSVLSGGNTVITVLDTIIDATLEGFILPVYDSQPAWITLATDLTPGHRWEVFNIGNHVVFNNGVELPFTWQQGETSVEPIYELREQGVGSVETITEFNGMLLCADLLELPEAELLTVLASGDPYGPFQDELIGVRRRFRIVYSAIGEPHRFGVTVDGDILDGATTLDVNIKPFGWEVGTTLLLVGAGVNGSNLETNIATITPTGYTLDDPNASLGDLTDTPVFEANNFNLAPIPGGFYDPHADESGILRMVELRGRLFIFRDTMIMIGSYTGNVGDPLDFQIAYRGPRSLFWRWSVARIQGQALIYAGQSDFYTIDLTSQIPQPILTLTRCKDLYFDNVTEQYAEQIFASENDMTEEAWFHFPGDALAYDYKYDTVSLVGREYTAGKTIIRPREARSNRAEERWYVGGRIDGAAVMYGLTSLDQIAFGNVKEIYGLGGVYSNSRTAYQIGTTVYVDGFFFFSQNLGSTIVWETGEEAKITNVVSDFVVEVDTFQNVPQGKFFVWESKYSAEISSGWGSLGTDFNEKDLRSYVLHGSSLSETPDVNVEIWGANNTLDGGTLLTSDTITSVDQENLIPLMVRDVYFKDRIILTDQLERFILAGRTYEAKLKFSRSMNRI